MRNSIQPPAVRTARIAPQAPLAPAGRVAPDAPFDRGTAAVHGCSVAGGFSMRRAR